MKKLILYTTIILLTIVASFCTLLLVAKIHLTSLMPKEVKIHQVKMRKVSFSTRYFIAFAFQFDYETPENERRKSIYYWTIRN